MSFCCHIQSSPVASFRCGELPSRQASSAAAISIFHFSSNSKWMKKWRFLTRIILKALYQWKNILEELNILSLVPCSDTLKYSSLHAEPDFNIVRDLENLRELLPKKSKQSHKKEFWLLRMLEKLSLQITVLKLNHIKVVFLTFHSFTCVCKFCQECFT